MMVIKIPMPQGFCLCGIGWVNKITSLPYMRKAALLRPVMKEVTERHQEKQVFFFLKMDFYKS